MEGESEGRREEEGGRESGRGLTEVDSGLLCRHPDHSEVGHIQTPPVPVVPFSVLHIFKMADDGLRGEGEEG